MKRAQGLSITTVIIAALALIVFVLLVFMFTGRIQLFSSGLTYCAGTCVDFPQACLDLGMEPIALDGCSEDREVASGSFCCMGGS